MLAQRRWNPFVKVFWRLGIVAQRKDGVPPASELDDSRAHHSTIVATSRSGAKHETFFRCLQVCQRRRWNAVRRTQATKQLISGVFVAVCCC